MKILFILLFSLEFLMLNSKIIQTKDLSTALSTASPGDIIELQSGTYNSIPYRLKSGTKDKPITLKAAEGANVVFTGTNSLCIFEFSGVSYASIEGPFELKDALCGVKAMDVTNVKISGLKIHNTQQHGIVISGENNLVTNNEVYNCVLENKIVGKTLDGGWSQCVSSWGKNYNSGFSQNIVFEKNYIHDSYGEGLDFLKCDNCSAIKNNITNGFSMNIYLDASKNILIEGNILRVNSDAYDTKWGSACGVGMSSESGNEYNIENIIIQNNIMIGTRMGIYFFQIGEGSGYSNVKILFNTMWQVSVAPLWFREPKNSPTNCELINNFMYVDWYQDIIPKEAWYISNNYYYNKLNVPSQYSDTNSNGGSRAAETLDLSTVFNNKNGNCNYFDKNLDPECLRPSPNPNDWLKLYHSGTTKSTTVKINKDFSGCPRSETTPSIGAYEYPSGCNESKDEGDKTCDGEQTGEVKVKFKINYCTSGNEVVKMAGEFCSWDVSKANTFINEGNCDWSYTFDKQISSFEYKFIISNGNSAKWESGSNRIFNLSSLINTANSNPNGNYQNCTYNKSGNTITLTCSWK